MKNKKKSQASNIVKILNDISQKVEPVILEILASHVDKKYQPIIKYQTLSGGKRLRPALAIMSCRLLGGKTNQVLYPAALLEILNNYTLIVDDIIDHSLTRRNQPTVWKKYGTSIAELISMSYAASIFDPPSKVKIKNKDKIFQLLASTLKTIISGQFYDVLFEQSGRRDESYIIKNRYKQISLQDYFAMIKQKTASLMQTSCQVGGLSAQASVKNVEHLKKFGFNLGIAFQIHDDLLDIFGEQKKFGKKIGKDIEESKLGNIVILLAWQEFKTGQRKKFISILKKERISASQLKQAINLIKNTQAQTKALKMEAKFIKRAEKSLALLPQNKWNNNLKDLFGFSITRSH